VRELTGVWEEHSKNFKVSLQKHRDKKTIPDTIRKNKNIGKKEPGALFPAKRRIPWIIF
jgi:hypothetical protein